MDTSTVVGAQLNVDGALQSRVDELERTLAQAREALDSVERRHAIDLALMDADAVDLESARLLTEVAVAGLKDRDVKSAVADLKKRKPFLFRQRATSPVSAGAMSGAPPRRDRAGAASEDAAEEAIRTGDRRALLRYLRARRGK